MWFRSLISIFLIVLSNHSLAINCESLILDDFKFQFKNGELVVSLLDEEISKTRLNVKFINHTSNKNLISGFIQARDSETVCNKIQVSVDPVKLCRDASNNIEDWRFVTFGDTEILSVVSLTAEVGDDVVLNKSRVCRESVVEGRVYIEESHIMGGEITGLPNNINEPEIPRLPDLPPEDEEPLLETMPKTVSWKRSKGNPHYLNYYTVKMKKTVIEGGPNITGSNIGITMNEVWIHNSPTLSGEISLERSDIRGNGNYSGVSYEYYDGLFQPLVTHNLTGDENDISGIYFFEREVTNSLVEGEILLNSSGDLDMVAHIGPHEFMFINSEFKGFGYIGAQIQENIKIHGYYVHPITHGVIFDDGIAINTVNISGAMYITGNSHLSNSVTVIGNNARNNLDLSLHIHNSTLTQQVYISGSPHIYLSSISHNSSVVGDETLVSRSNIYNSSVSCNAFVNCVTLTDYIVGCHKNQTMDIPIPPPCEILPPYEAPPAFTLRSSYDVARRTVKLFKEKNLKAKKFQNSMEVKAKNIQLLKEKMKARL